MISDKVTLFNIQRKLSSLHMLDDSKTVSKIVNKAACFGMLLLEASYFWRARWDLNPRSPAPKADALIRAGLRALLEEKVADM